MKKPTLQYAALGMLLLWALLAQLTFIAFEVYLQANAGYDLPVPFTTRLTQVIGIAPGYDESGLRIGDDIVAVNGQMVRGVKQIDDLPFSLHPGHTLVITVRRAVAGGVQTLDIPIRMHPRPVRPFDWVTVLVIRVFLPLSCIFVGFYIALARPRDPLAWITLGMLASFAEMLERESLWIIWPPWREILIVYSSLLNSVWPLWLVLFALYFPVPFSFLNRRRWISWLVALPFLCLAAFSLYGDLMEGNHAREIGGLAGFAARIENPLRVVIGAYISAFFMLLGWKQRIAKTSDARRRLRVMMTGCSLALAPLLLVVLAEVKIIPPLPDWAATICLLMLIFFPITMAYVIVVQRAMDVRMVIRTGVRYAVASTGLRVARMVLLGAIVWLTIYFGTRSGYIWQAVVIGSGVALAIAFRRLALRASQWMDRRFFREAYKAEIILTELSNSVAGIRDRKALLETVTHRIADSLHVPRIAVLLEQGNVYQPAYALGFNSHVPPVELKPDATTIRLLKRERTPSKIYFDDPQSWVQGASEIERKALRALDAQLLLPVSLKTRMLGVISLGPKRSEAPYSKADLQLLSAVASQTGLALENAELTETIRKEVAERERANRELEIAREVQERLFPQILPHVEAFDFAGYCRPALGVGGDYYDFIRLPDGALGLAIGDVSGKGIAAALMMASLQASLRGQTIRPCSDLSEMIRNVNRLVYEASAENRYATFFYAQFRPKDRILRYVNAGHNPPILSRGTSDRRQILRLEKGGTVLGLFPDSPYAEAQIQLQSGDILVAFTDGISEAMNGAEEEFDEVRLIDAIESCDSRPAGEMIKLILEQVDAFTEGARQHDDMTLVTARVQ